MWLWCPTCERCFRTAQWRRNAWGLPLCHYPDCDGLWSEAWPWSQLWHFNSTLPAVPEPNVRYPHPTAVLSEFQAFRPA